MLRDRLIEQSGRNRPRAAIRKHCTNPRQFSINVWCSVPLNTPWSYFFVPDIVHDNVAATPCQQPHPQKLVRCYFSSTSVVSTLQVHQGIQDTCGTSGVRLLPCFNPVNSPAPVRSRFARALVHPRHARSTEAIHRGEKCFICPFCVIFLVIVSRTGSSIMLPMLLLRSPSDGKTQAKEQIAPDNCLNDVLRYAY
jgi:hypothetical protein